MSTEKLLKMKTQIDEAKQKKSEINGKRSSTIEQMKAKFGVDNIEDADKELKKRGDELDKMEDEFNKELAELEQNFPVDAEPDESGFHINDMLKNQQKYIQR